ncbi:MAG: type II toxin-antitoxin system antitoxin SocA domain-containing protein [Cyclobacteriaceae bacterium]
MINQEDIGNRIATLRKRKDLSQLELAKMLEMTRPSLAQIELGNRNINARELLKLSEILEVSIDNLLGKNFMINHTLPEEKVKKKKQEPEERVSVPDLKVDKFKQVLLYILERCAGKPNIGETVLNKLLYFIEFNYYERYEQHMIGATFKKLQFGPVPQNMDAILSKMEEESLVKTFKTDYHGFMQKRFLPLAKPDLTQLKASEIEIIDHVISTLSDFSAKSISLYSHKDLPWKATEDGEVIDYELALYREPPYTARIYNNGPE